MNTSKGQIIERDFVGYGGKPPSVRWPGNARMALNFLSFYEEGAERCPLFGDDYSEHFQGEIALDPLPKGMRFMANESIYEYGARAGFWRIMRLFEKYQIESTILLTGHALQFNPAICEYLSKSSHECGGKSWRFTNYATMSAQEEKEHMELCIKAITELTGKRPQGWATGRSSENTRRLLVEIGGFLYDSDSWADDLPYYQNVSGKRHLIIPYSLDCNDSRYVCVPGYACSNDFYVHLKDTFDYLYQEGESNPTMMTVPLHFRTSGRPGRTAAVERFIQYVLQFKDVWICRREEIANHWLKSY
jgi:peptidoglycan/xylan/chitin deacetylase (PgdA/CDA1 family)